MSYRSALRVSLALCALFLALPAAARPIADPSDTAQIHLRRAVFDPLQRLPAAAATLGAQPATSLRLVQLDGPPDAATASRLRSAGFEPLLYIPDNAFVVRQRDQVASGLPAWVRWEGPFAPAYKISPELDGALRPTQGQPLDLYVQPTPDAEPAALVQAIGAAGGRAEAGTSGILRAQIGPAGLSALVARDDVLWVERYRAPTLHNDQARVITGVDASRQQLPWLTGAGQVVAVTDTGLDVQADVEGGRNPDFSPERIARGFTNRDMNSSCAGDTWNDRNGHGTHVAGTILGSGGRSPANTFAGVAPGASLVVQAVSSGGNSLDCLLFDTFLPKAYDAGARVQNASWGTTTGSGSCVYGCYSSLERSVDTFLWNHPEHLLVVSAGNAGKDTDQNGVVDRDSIGSPASAKNVLTVGATENNRPALTQRWGDSPWSYPPTSYLAEPIRSDRIGDNPNGLAAFSSRGPTDDGRIKPEIVAPGVRIISSRSHDPTARDRTQGQAYNDDYMYDSGTSMSTPMLSGMAALVRQWLAEQHNLATPSAALVKALLLNGATNLSPGQYGAGPAREIPQAWPNSAQGWGRANLQVALGLGDSAFSFHDQRGGLQTGESATYSLTLGERQSARVTLVWTDYPAAPNATKALVNDLDLEVLGPNGAIVAIGNAGAELPAQCRDSASGADRCNNVEGLEFLAEAAGTYTLRVRGASVARGPQPFALASGAGAPAIAPASAPSQLSARTQPGSPAIALSWSAVEGATSYELRQRTLSSASSAGANALVVVAERELVLVADIGTYEFVVRACNAGGCGPESAPVEATITTAPSKTFWPLLGREG